MKKITALLAIFLISLSSYGQDEVNTSFASQMNTIFGQLDKTNSFLSVRAQSRTGKNQ